MDLKKVFMRKMLNELSVFQTGILKICYHYCLNRFYNFCAGEISKCVQQMKLKITKMDIKNDPHSKIFRDNLTFELNNTWQILLINLKKIYGVNSYHYSRFTGNCLPIYQLCEGRILKDLTNMFPPILPPRNKQMQKQIQFSGASITSVTSVTATNELLSRSSSKIKRFRPNLLPLYIENRVYLPYNPAPPSPI